MQPCAIADTRLYSMAEGMAEIEQRTLACFSLISADDFSFDLTRPGNGVVERFTIAVQQCL